MLRRELGMGRTMETGIMYVYVGIEGVFFRRLGFRCSARVVACDFLWSGVHFFSGPSFLTVMLRLFDTG